MPLDSDAPSLSQQYLDPAPVGIDARLVIELDIGPQITTGVLHASSGAGQIGAGVAHQPLAPFRAALEALAVDLDEAAG